MTSATIYQFHAISVILYAGAIVFLGLSVVLFFVFDIKKIIEIMTKTGVRKERERLREGITGSNRKRISTAELIKKNTAGSTGIPPVQKDPQSETLPLYSADSDMPETTTLKKADTEGEMETSVLVEQSKKTVPLSESKKARKRASFSVTREILVAAWKGEKK